ncbi:MAG: hypothetical protein GF329_18385, partial [Candidatus Lokiarchaeota archaeon]|nr:hypothetical protein [Candidatus Lokiarchaeota archaeon]
MMLNVEKIKNLIVVIIKIKKEKYLLEVKNVKEIYVPGDKIIPVPLSSKEVVGIIDIRGEIYTIFSLRNIIYDKDLTYDLNEDSRILLLELKNLNLAILVDSVIGVKTLPTSIFDNRNVIIETQIDYKYIKAIGVLDEEAYILLDLKAVIPPELLRLDTRPLARPKISSRKKSKKPVEKKDTLDDEKYDVPDFGLDKSIFEDQESLQELESFPEKQKIKLTEEQKDTLREIGNIGSGNAITALSNIIKKKIDVNLTDIGILSSENLASQFGGADQYVAGIFSQIKKPSKSTIIQVFEMNPLLNLITSLTESESKIDTSEVTSREDLDTYTISTIKEIGNIMAGHYTSALADLIGKKLMIQTPNFTLSKAGKLSEFLIEEFDSISDFVVLIKTSLHIADMELSGVFFFIPDSETLDYIFQELDIEYETQLSGKVSEKTQKVVDIVKNIDLNNIELNDIQRDALQEVGNIGAGNAANVLAKMIGKRVDMNIPSVEMTRLEDFAKKISKTNRNLFVCWSNIKGKTKATILSIFDVDDIIDLTSIIIEDFDKKQIDLRKKYKNINDFPEIYKDAMAELGHIMGSHYTSAIGDLLDIRLMTDPPDMSINKGSKFSKILIDEIGLIKEISLVITTNIMVKDLKINGTFLYIPNIDTLK